MGGGGAGGVGPRLRQRQRAGGLRQHRRPLAVDTATSRYPLMSSLTFLLFAITFQVILF